MKIEQGELRMGHCIKKKRKTMNHPKLSESITAIEGGLEEQPRLGTTPSEPSDRSLVQLTTDQLNIERLLAKGELITPIASGSRKAGCVGVVDVGDSIPAPRLLRRL